ncbi:MAG: peptidase M4 [Peptococcaceae bacterium]|nr:peptidase M4 [Peptococcaceae bacterium]
MKENTKKRILAWLSLTFFVAFGLSLAWGIYEYRLLNEQKTALDNQYKRALNDLVTDVNEMETSMAKAKVANGPSLKVLYFGEIWKSSDTAVNRFSQIPSDEIGISYVETLVNQIADFSKSMTQKVAATGTMNANEAKIFDDMHQRIIEINRSLQDLSNQYYAENLAWIDKSPGIWEKLGIGKLIQATAQGGEKGGDPNQGDPEAARQAGEQTPSSVRGGLRQLDTSLQKYPPLSYKGDLDKHYVEKPLGLPEGVIDERKAITVAKDFLHKLGFRDAEPQVTGHSDSPLGGFNLSFKDAYLEISKKGGVVTYYRNQRELNERRLDVPKAIEKGYAALKKLGWDLVVTSTEDLDSYVMVEAVAQDKGVRIYPDKVRMTIAMDNGELIGFDANAYYAYHHDRQLNKKLSLAEAKSKLAKNFKIIEERLAVISKIGNEEAFCYEFRGTAFGEEYLIYIDAVDGSEVKISRVVNTPRGKLIQ